PWYSDGTAEGTVLLRDIIEGPPGSGMVQLQAGPDFAVFRANNALGGHDIWVTEGTAASTRRLAVDGLRTVQGLLMPLGEQIPLGGVQPGQGLELWVVPVTGGGSPVCLDLNAGPGDSRPSEGYLHEDVLYFQAYTEAYGMELWRSDGTADGTYMIEDIRPGPG